MRRAKPPQGDAWPVAMVVVPAGLDEFRCHRKRFAFFDSFGQSSCQSRPQTDVTRLQRRPGVKVRAEAIASLDGSQLARLDPLIDRAAGCTLLAGGVARLPRFVRVDPACTEMPRNSAEPGSLQRRRFTLAKGFGRRPLAGRSCGLWGRCTKASQGGNRGEVGGWLGGRALWGFWRHGPSAGGTSGAGDEDSSRRERRRRALLRRTVRAAGEGAAAEKDWRA